MMKRHRSEEVVIQHPCLPRIVAAAAVMVTSRQKRLCPSITSKVTFTMTMALRESPPFKQTLPTVGSLTILPAAATAT
jgi:hypothetical protein